MNKRMWSDEETKAFVGFMKEFVVDGLKTDSGQFKPGTFKKLALKMLEAFPTCTITAKHCKNKHKRLKEKYQYASEMLACSGFGWNSKKQCVEVDSKDVLDAWTKVAHPTKFYTVGKPFPLFHRLEGIFGKDRATGVSAASGFNTQEQVHEEGEDQSPGILEGTFGKDRATGVDAINGFNTQEQVHEEEEDQIPGLDEFEVSANTSFDGEQGAASHSEAGAASARHSGKKRKQNDILERMVECVRFSIAAQEKHVQILADAISGVNERFKIGEKLEQLGFSDDEVVQVVLKFSDNSNLEKSFWSLTNSQKSALVRSILR
ncbi:uncharacterized protein LOC107481776 isoform X1 [Arachis duranensis]|uniref:Uncharacterized protein LOC107481776 isoform X1 n=1 Tax=Arachis duranensis TaxID=130453 RepID=A0A6P4D154_ARADU|nr:uncharacterized protein LOC107481776 isoform X1 [Arachis duranensis]XP_015957573.1 uncharacterized protein LOC107481776 isoform X1 [Arachis duranensis]